MIPYVTESYKGRLPVNWYPVSDAEKGIIFQSRPGLKKFISLSSDSGQVRSLRIAANKKLYAVSGQNAYEIDQSFNVTLLGSMSSPTGPVWIEDNGYQVMFADDGGGYIWDYVANTWSQITVSLFPTIGSLAYQNTFFIISEKDTRRVYLSASNDGTTWDLTDVQAREAADNVVGIVNMLSELWIIGDTSSEMWMSAPGETFPYLPVTGAYIQMGCVAPKTIGIADNTLLWLTDKRQLVRTSGIQPKYVSTRKLEKLWQTYPTVDDAIGIPYVWDGHWFYMLTFPSEDKTFVLDLSLPNPVKAWHEEATYQRSSTDQLRHRANCYAFFSGKHIIGDDRSQELWEMSDDNYSDDGLEIVRILETPELNSENRKVLYPKVQAEFMCGLASPSGQGSNPLAQLQVSDDGGFTWWDKPDKPIGRIGEYKARTIWRRNGAARRRCFRLIVTDPTIVTLTDLIIKMEAGTT